MKAHMEPRPFVDVGSGTTQPLLSSLATSASDTSLAGGMAHEFNNTLTTILGYAEMLAEVLPPESSELDFIEQIIEAGRRAETIVEQVLIISRRGRYMTRPFDVLEAASEMLPALYTSVSQTTRLAIDLADAPMVMAGTPRELEHVLVNLCRNASEAQNGEGSVVLSMSPHDQDVASPLSHGSLTPGAYIRMSVRDDGPGIPPEHQHRVFNPFFTTGSNNRHAGLGLSVVRATVVALNGQMNVLSRPAEGTCFDLYFPRLDD